MRRLDVTRGQILAHRRRVGALDERLPPGTPSLERSAWEDPALVQVWGPRFSAYVVAAKDRAVFTLGRLPDDARGRRFAEDLATRLNVFLDGRRMTYREAGRALGVHP